MKNAEKPKAYFLNFFPFIFPHKDNSNLKIPQCSQGEQPEHQHATQIFWLLLAQLAGCSALYLWGNVEPREQCSRENPE